MDPASTPDARVDNGHPPGETQGSTRRTYVTSETRTILATNVVLTSIASFLRDKVFPIVGENCRINLHWDGIDLSTLHIQSVIPDNYILVQRKTPDSCNNSSNWPHLNSSPAVRINGDSTMCPTKMPTSQDQTSTMMMMGPPLTPPTYCTIKTEDFLANGKDVFNPQKDQYSNCGNVVLSDDLKLCSSEPRIIITRHGETNLSGGTLSLLNPAKQQQQQLPSIRAKAVSGDQQPSPLLLPTPPDMTPHPLCLPQTVSASSIIPLVPVVTYLQPQMTLGQVNTQSTLLPSIPITQVQPVQAFHQISVPACTTTNAILQSTPTYTMQPLTVSVPIQPARFQVRQSRGPARISSTQTNNSRKIIRGTSHLTRNSIKCEPVITKSPPPPLVVPRQVKVTAKRFSAPPSATQLLVKGGQIVLKSAAGKIPTCKRSPTEIPVVQTPRATQTTVTTTTATTTIHDNGASSILRTKSPRLTKVSIVAYGQDDEPPIVYPALGSQPLEKLFDTL